MPKCKRCGRRYERAPPGSPNLHRCELETEKMSPWVLRILLLILLTYAVFYGVYGGL